MKSKPKLTRIRLQDGSIDRMGRPLPGLFELLIDEDRVRKLAERAYSATGQKSTWGGLTVIFRPCSPGQAEYLVKQANEPQREVEHGAETEAVSKGKGERNV